MNFTFTILILLLGLLGHVVLWVGIVNRTHAYAWPRKLIDGLTVLSGILLVAMPILVGSVFWWNDDSLSNGEWNSALWATWLLVGAFAVLFLITAVHWLWTLAHPETRGNLVENHTTIYDLRAITGDPLAASGVPRMLSRLPLNQVVTPHFHEKKLVIPRLASQHAGLRIVHLTDLHMSGRISKRYFEEVVQRVNNWQPDLIAITGDIVERTECLPWIPDTLGQLNAQSGVYYVLGNHDKKVDCQQLRADLNNAGLTDVAGRCVELTSQNVPLILGGNEIPWFAPAASFEQCPAHDAEGLPLRVALSHSPDQFPWAQENAVDLMLAGHCHGGQVRFPLVGAVLAPSVHGTRYASGIFRKGNTVMHVSRGTSGLAPFRFNCPPEVSLLELRSKNG